MLFILPRKLFSFSRYFSFCFSRALKRLDLKDEFNFKFYDITAWLTNYFSTHITKYLEK